MESLTKARDVGARRICLQCLNDPDHLSRITDLIREIRANSNLPISLSIGPVSHKRARELKEAGVERVGIALDGASDHIFELIKGKRVGNPFTFEDTWKALKTAVLEFGEGRVSTHLIVGLGETDREMYDSMMRARSAGVLVSLFSFTPMPGIMFEGKPPPLGRYRSLQVLRHSIFVTGVDLQPVFDESGKLERMDLDSLTSLDLGQAFRTSGCPDCNRPYYNERPKGDIYNYPYFPEKDRIIMELEVLRGYLGF